MDNFDLKKYLVENKVTTNSRMLNEAEQNSVAVDSSDIAKIQQSSDVQKLAAAVAKDPKAMAKLDQIMQKAGVTLEESEGVDIDSSDVKKIASVISSHLNEEAPVSPGERMMAGFFGGAVAMFIPGALETVNHTLGLATYNPAGGIAAMVAGTLLAAVYSLIKGEK